MVTSTVLAAVVALIAQASPLEGSRDEWVRLDELRESLEAAVDNDPSDTYSRLRLLAVLVLDGDYQRATDMATGAFKSGGLHTPRREQPKLDTLTRIFDALIARPADAEGAIELLEQRPAPCEPESGDLAWPVAEAFALARAGESHKAAAAFEHLAGALREGAGLRFENYVFVRRVLSFGVYELDRRSTRCPGDDILVYAEPEGFTRTALAPAAGGAQEWRVRLRLSVKLVDRAGGAVLGVWGPDEIRHIARAEIRDLHVTRLIGLPRDLSPGSYELHLSAGDLEAEGSEALGIRMLEVSAR